MRSEDNREVVKIAATTVTAIVGAGWVLFTFVVEHRSAADKAPPQSISATAGAVAAGRDASGNTITVAPPRQKMIGPE